MKQRIKNSKNNNIRLVNIIFFILLTTTSIFSIPTVYADVSISDGLLAHYPFDGNTKDVSGNEFHQIISGNNGAVFLTEDRLGTFDSAYEFGETQGVMAASNGTSNMFKPFLNGLTVSFWAYPSVKANLNKYGFFSIGYPGNTGVGGLQFGYEGRSDDSHHDFFLAGAQRTEDIPKVVEINKWQHFTITITPGAAATETLTSTFATSDIIFYKNGVRIKKTSYYALSIYQRPGSRLHIGWISCCGGYKGKLDDVRIYDRVLSDAEISRIPGDIPSPTEDEVSSNPPPILSLTPSDSGSSNIVHLECNQPVDINLDHADGKWNLNFNGIITQQEINLEKNYHVSDCGAKWVIHLEDPNDRNVISNTIEIVWANKVLPPMLSLASKNMELSNTVRLECNEAIDIIPEHTEGKWNVYYNGEISQYEIDLQEKYSVAVCGEEWTIHLEEPNNSSNRSNTIKIVWDSLESLVDGEIAVNVLSGGLGRGVVISETPGLILKEIGEINCPSYASSIKCKGIFTNTVTLLAKPEPGSKFTGWNGACTGISNRCVISGHNQNVWAVAGFERNSNLEENELTEHEILNGLVDVFEIVNGSVHRISALEAARKYSWVADAIKTNASNNLRGMIISGKAHNIYKITGKTGRVLQHLQIGIIAAKNLPETIKGLDEIINSDNSIKEKLALSSIEVARFPVEVTAEYTVSQIHSLSTILRHTKYINPIYWTDVLFDINRFDESITQVDYWVNEVKINIEEFETNEAYKILNIASDRFVEFMIIDGLANQSI